MSVSHDYLFHFWTASAIFFFFISDAVLNGNTCQWHTVFSCDEYCVMLRGHIVLCHTADLHSCFLLLANFVFAFGMYARFLLDLYFNVSHAVIIGLISLQSLFARYPIAFSNGWWHRHPNCWGKLRLWALLFSQFTFLFVSLWCQLRSDYELWDVFFIIDSHVGVFYLSLYADA